MSIGPAVSITEGVVLRTEGKFVQTGLRSTHVGFKRWFELTDDMAQANVFTTDWSALRDAERHFTLLDRVKVKVTRKVEVVTEELDFTLKG